jgi:hypothetical protein
VPEAAVTVVAQHPPYSLCFVVMVHNQLLFRRADGALGIVGFQDDKVFVADYMAKLTAGVGITILTAALAAPAIEPITSAVVKREVDLIQRLADTALGAGFA